MSWIAIIGWILMNLPDIIALIRRILGRVTQVRKEALRERLSAIIQAKNLSRAEKRALVRAVVTQMANEDAQEELRERDLVGRGIL